ncbi:MAG TPA: hypothetical protein VLE91_01480 [Candidatus Saccharimonadales bacterium]|nr:hypothetical protein [Candidatus Saccharimonadales bacterium]
MKYPTQSDLWRLDFVNKTKPMETNGQSRVLGYFKQVFPLALFRDELIIEELRIVQIQNNGPWTTHVNSIMATDIACVDASTGPFFGHIHVKSLTGGAEILVDNLTRADVYKIRSIVEGIALASREGLKVMHQDLEVERQQVQIAGSLVV